MKKLIIIIFLFINISFAQEVIPISFNDYGLIFIKAKVNDEVGNFILDTGGGAHILSNNFYTKIKDELKPAGVYTGFRYNGERIDSEVFTTDAISIGSLTQTKPYLGVYPPLDEYGIDGLISLKLFEENAFTIDFVNKQVIIETNESLTKLEQNAEILPILFDRERDKVLDMFITLCLNDSVSIQAEFDTGSGFESFILNKYYASKLGLQLDSLNRSSLDLVSLCGSSVEQKNKNVRIDNDIIYEGLIGSGLFRDKKLTIDIPNARILVRE